MDLNALIAAVPALAPYATVIFAVVGLVAAVMPWLPHPAGPGVYGAVYAVLNAVAMNFRHAANQPPAAAPAASPAAPPAARKAPPVVPPLAAVAALLMLGLGGCTGTPAQTQAGVTAVQGILTSLQALQTELTAGGATITVAEATALSTAIGDAAAGLKTVDAGGNAATVLATITTDLQALAPFVPVVATLLTLAQPTPAAPSPSAAPSAPVAHAEGVTLSPALAGLLSNYRALQGVAGAR